MRSDKVIILGAGLAGSLLAKMLRDKGFNVVVFEKRTDPRKAEAAEGRSINLALSHRGIQALKKADVFRLVEDDLILMTGRMMHDTSSNLTFQPYGKEGQGINSVSRNDLNIHLINAAESAGVEFMFDHKCEDVNIEETKVRLSSKGKTIEESADVILGADGAFSSLRRALQSNDRFNFEQMYIEHGYKELTMPPVGGNFAMEPNYLHIWPRGNYMLIALPNPDKTFTCTLFFPFEGEKSFESLNTNNRVGEFFEEVFPDAKKHIPNLLDQYESNPTSSLVTIRCSPWNYKRCMVIGDAAHAIVPFYGQGMNAAFEDCRLFLEMGEEVSFDWDQLLPKFAKSRKKDADAIADLALRNFIEMRDQVADDLFLERKKAESEINRTLGDDWIPLYSMVTFSDLPYSRAKEKGYMQEEALKIAQKKGVIHQPDEIRAIFNKLAQGDPSVYQ